jgi:hypothetical protein
MLKNNWTKVGAGRYCNAEYSIYLDKDSRRWVLSKNSDNLFNFDTLKDAKRWFDENF